MLKSNPNAPPFPSLRKERLFTENKTSNGVKQLKKKDYSSSKGYQNINKAKNLTINSNWNILRIRHTLSNLQNIGKKVILPFQGTFQPQSLSCYIMNQELLLIYKT